MMQIAEVAGVARHEAGTPNAMAALEAHREAILGHCYRMLGSSVDAEDALQETLLRGWRALDGFDERSSLRTWLHRIATNVCLDALRSRSKRELPTACGPAGTVDDELITRERTHWLEPVPDARALPPDADPQERLVLRESIRLAFVAALQYLPPRQRGALLLREVLGHSAAEAADCLDMTVPAVNSALQRARATLAERGSDVGRLSASSELGPEQQVLIERYVEAFHNYDVPALQSLLCEEVTLSMPPYALWLRGPEAIGRWFLGRGIGCRGSRLVPIAASGSPAFGQYRVRACDGPDGPSHQAWSLVVLELKGNTIAAMTHFLDVETLFPRFGLPLTLST